MADVRSRLRAVWRGDAPIDKLSVVVAVVLGVVLLGAPFSAKLALGIALIASGAIVIATI